MFIKVVMFIPLCIYSILDYYQTVSLLKCGMEEINPIVLWLIGPDENWELLLAAKIAFLVMVAILLFVDYINSRERIQS